MKVTSPKNVKFYRTRYTLRRIKRESRKHGPVRYYSIEEIRALNRARGLI